MIVKTILTLSMSLALGAFTTSCTSNRQPAPAKKDGSKAEEEKTDTTRTELPDLADLETDNDDRNPIGGPVDDGGTTPVVTGGNGTTPSGTPSTTGGNTTSNGGSTTANPSTTTPSTTGGSTDLNITVTTGSGQTVNLQWDGLSDKDANNKWDIRTVQ